MNDASDTQALLLLIGLIAGGWFAGMSVNRIPDLRQRPDPWLRWALAAIAVPVGAIGGFAILGGVFDLLQPGSNAVVSVIVVVMGAALLAPFAKFFYDQRRARPAKVEQPPGAVRPAFVPAAPPAPEQRPLAVPAVPPPFVPAPAPAPAAVGPLSGFEDDDEASPFAAEYQFNYESATGDVDERLAYISHVSSSGGRIYFEGHRTDTLQARSYRVDRVVGNMIDTYSGTPYEAELLADLFGPPSTRDTAQFSPADSAHSAPRAGWRTGVCFLGFGYAKEQELSDLAEAADWKVLGDVSKHADYVVLNGRAGARQRQRAEDAGATVIDEDTFRAMV